MLPADSYVRRVTETAGIIIAEVICYQFNMAVTCRGVLSGEMVPVAIEATVVVVVVVVIVVVMVVVGVLCGVWW